MSFPGSGALIGSPAALPPDGALCGFMLTLSRLACGSPGTDIYVFTSSKPNRPNILLSHFGPMRFCITGGLLT